MYASMPTYVCTQCVGCLLNGQFSDNSTLHHQHCTHNRLHLLNTSPHNTLHIVTTSHRCIIHLSSTTSALYCMRSNLVILPFAGFHLEHSSQFCVRYSWTQPLLTASLKWLPEPSPTTWTFPLTAVGGS